MSNVVAPGGVIVNRHKKRRGERATTPAAGAVTQPLGTLSPIRVSANHLVDQSGRDLGVLKGFNTNVASTVGGENFAFSAADYNAQAAIGARVVRLPLHWDVFEQAQGTVHGITSPTGTATSGSAVDSLDISIGRALAAGMYVLLDLPHLNVDRIPAWVPATAAAGPLTGQSNELARFAANGQFLAQTLAERYGDPNSSKYARNVAAGCLNESPSTSLPDIMLAYETIVPWMRAKAPYWITWVEPTGFGNGTPYPTSATQIDTTRLLNLDQTGAGVVVSWHTYLNKLGSNGLSYQGNGTIGPLDQVTNGAHFYGWAGDDPVYPDTGAARTALANHIAWWTTLKAVSGRLALAVTEFGHDGVASSGHDAWVRDSVDSFRAAGASAELWWQYGTNTSAFNSGSSTGSGFRSAISGSQWMTSATARA